MCRQTRRNQLRRRHGSFPPFHRKRRKKKKRRRRRRRRKKEGAGGSGSGTAAVARSCRPAYGGVKEKRRDEGGVAW
jgi:hypothetical protein